MERDDPRPLRIELLCGQLALAQVTSAESHREAQQRQLAAHFAADATISARHHGHRQVNAHAANLATQGRACWAWFGQIVR
jgi:hypothetical protein